MVTSCSSASPFTMLLSPPNPSLSSSTRNSVFSLRSTFFGAAGGGGASSSFSSFSTPPTRRSRRKKYFSVSASAAAAGALQALIFDCDGVILESEHLHRQAYNDAFSHFKVRCSSAAPEPLNWGLEFYDELQNRIGGGKPKMRWYFKEYGWPSSTIFQTPPENDKDREKLIDIVQDAFCKTQPFEAQMIRSEVFPSVPKDGKLPLKAAVLLDVFTVFAHQDWKTERYKEILKSGTVEPRPGVLRLMDEAKAAGKKLAVCSAATKSSVILCLENLIGLERFQGLDCFLAGDDVKEKKPDPSIYVTAAKKLGVSGGDCLVVEDSVIGLQAATSAGMPCIITYTSSTANQDFKEAIAKYPDLGDVRLKDLEILLQSVVAAN